MSNRIDHHGPSHSKCDEHDNPLEHVKAGNKEYDLTTKQGREAFERDIADLKLDGKADGALGGCADGVSYDRKTHTVMVGDKTYDLDKAKDLKAFQNDAADGYIDGKSADGNNKHVKVGDKTYDLSSEKGRKQFAADVGDVQLDTQYDDCGQVEYDPKTNIATINGKEYDLDKKADVKAFQKDANDGRLDGQDTRHAKNIKLGDREFNLNTEAGRDEFATAINDGELDLETLGCGGLEYDRATNAVRAGDKWYNMGDPKQVKQLQADAADGVLDGVDSKHLKDVKVGDDSYDLSTAEGRQELKTAIEEGLLGVAFDETTSYDADSNTVTVGDKQYDLNDPRQARAFQRDCRDGMLDGEIRKHNSHGVRC